jgi:hypothetical protein
MDAWEEKPACCLNGRGIVRQGARWWIEYWDWVMDLIRWFRAPFAWRFVHQDAPWTYFENTVTGQRRCRWDGGRYTYVDYDFIRPGDIVEGPFGREVVTDYVTFSPAFRS